jgi:hypothetical protein
VSNLTVSPDRMVRMGFFWDGKLPMAEFSGVSFTW